jgi:O-antigen ligase
MLLAALSMPHEQRERLMLFCVGAATLGIILGAAQLAAGGARLHPWPTTTAGTVSGFFANRNHLATYLLVVLPFAIITGAASMRRRGRQLTPLWLAALFVGLVVIGIAAIRSRAGVALFVPTLAVSLLAAWIAAGRGRIRKGFLALVGSAGIALTVVAVMALPPILARFDTKANAETRFDRWPLVAETAQTYLPLGSGIGSFNSIYRSVEPLEELDPTYFNQAHNDYLELWLETGWVGLILIVVFLIWYGRRCWIVWRAETSRPRDLQRAASIGIAVILLHSAVDYPLRTVTITILLALCCALLAPAAPSAERSMSKVRV